VSESDEPDDDPGNRWPSSLIGLDAAGLIVTANAHFVRLTGYRREDLIGRMRWRDVLTAGSQLLHETQVAPRLALEFAVDEVMVELVGADGQRIPGLMSAAINPVAGARAGTQIVLMAVPDRREYESRLRQARVDAEAAQAESAQTRARLELLAAANMALASSIDIEVALTRLARALVDRVADWCIVYAFDDAHPEAPGTWAAANSDPMKQALLERLAELIPTHATPTAAISRVLNDNVPVLLATVSDEHQELATDDRSMLGLYRELGLASAMVVPSAARGQRVAILILARGLGRPPFTADDLDDLTDLGGRTGVVIDNHRRHAREHNTSVALQQALLTEPPTIEPFTIITRYLPATDGAEVGGDWYDAFAQPGGGIAIAIGDVVGHDIQAAARMGQLRGIIRTIATAIPGTPADTLVRADRAAHTLRVDTLASAIIAQIEQQPSDTTGGRVVLWSNAGHPPPLLIAADGTVHVLERRADPLLGLGQAFERHDHSLDLHPGDTLLLYTDGLIEGAKHDIDAGLARLVDSAAGGNTKSVPQLCDDILAGHDGRHDDIAILAIRAANY
jgi:PAS domain S-box-containing protein